MKSDKAKNSIRNSIWGIALRIISMLCTFVVRTAIIKVLGIDYCGLNSLFVSVLQLLSISELGFGSAMVIHMYKPIATGNNEELSALLKLYRKIYRIIGCFVTVIGLALLPFLRHLIKGEVPDDINLYLLYLIYLCNNAISYFLFSYRRSLFFAAQRSDIESKILLTSNITLSLCQIGAITLLRSYYVYAVFIPLCTVFSNLLIYYFSKKYFPSVTCIGSVSTETSKNIKQKVKALFGHKIGGIIVSAIDSIVVSTMFGLFTLGIFNNYYYLILSIGSFIDIFFQSIRASIGVKAISNDREKDLEDFRFIQFVSGWFNIACVICLVCLLQPFMRLWVGSQNMTNSSSAYWFAALFFIWNFRKVCQVYKDATGNWERDWLKPYAESAFNIAFSFLFAYFWGINGVLVSSILSMCLISIPWETYALNKGFFKTRYLPLFTPWFQLIPPGVLSLIVLKVTLSFMVIDTIPMFIGAAAICAILPTFVFMIVYRKNPFVIRLFNIVKK